MNEETFMQECVIAFKYLKMVEIMLKDVYYAVLDGHICIEVAEMIFKDYCVDTEFEAVSEIMDVLV